MELEWSNSSTSVTPSSYCEGRQLNRIIFGRKYVGFEKQNRTLPCLHSSLQTGPHALLPPYLVALLLYCQLINHTQHLRLPCLDPLHLRPQHASVQLTQQVLVAGDQRQEGAAPHGTEVRRTAIIRHMLLQVGKGGQADGGGEVPQESVYLYHQLSCSGGTDGTHEDVRRDRWIT